MDQALLRGYLATIYEIPTESGTLRASLDGETTAVPEALPRALVRKFAILTAYNPRSMLLPRRVNEARQLVMRDLLILGCYRVEPVIGAESEPEGVFREPAWIAHNMDREEAIAFGRVFRQNTIIVSDGGRPELIVTDPTADEVGRAVACFWRVRS